MVVTDKINASKEILICSLRALMFSNIMPILLFTSSSAYNSYAFTSSRNFIGTTRCLRCNKVQFLHICFIGALHSALKQKNSIGSAPCPLMIQSVLTQNCDRVHLGAKENSIGSIYYFYIKDNSYRNIFQRIDFIKT